MAIPSIFKKKSFYVILVILIIGGGYFYQRSTATKVVTYETVDAVAGKLSQTVEVTGEIKPAARIDLAFKASGTLKSVEVKVGDKIKKDQILAELKDEDLIFALRRSEAALAIAQANLNAKNAGESAQSIRLAETTVAQAQAAYDKASADYLNVESTNKASITTAQIALDTARNNLANSGSISDQALKNAIESSRTSLETALGSMNTALVDGDAIIGFDDTASNQTYKQYLGILQSGSIEEARSSYQAAKPMKIAAEKAVNTLGSASTQTDILAAADKVSDAIDDIQAYLLDVKTVLANSITSSYFTSTDLTAKKTIIDADYTAVSAQRTSVVAARQSMQSAVLGNVSDIKKLQDAVKTAQAAYDAAAASVQTNLSVAQSAVSIQKAALDNAKAALDLKKAKPRQVDIASLQAQVQDAAVARDQAAENLNNARIIAPVDGTISEVIADIGEEISPNVAEIRMVGTQSYDIEANVPEADIAKVVVGQTCVITLDSYGDDVKFAGTVTAEDPDQTKVQDAIYYKIRVSLDPNGKDVKPGMTANVIVTTGTVDDAIIVPLRAIKTDTATGQKSLRVLVDGKPEQRNIQIGLKGDEGKVQAASGVAVGDKIVVSESGQ